MIQGAELYLDCFAGIAGDMTLAALLDLGVPEEVVRAELEKLPIHGWKLERSRVQRGALVGEKIHVLVEHAHDDHGHHVHHDGHAEHAHAHRHYSEIRAMLCASLSGEVLARALAMFDRVARVEARLHGVPVEEVAFHEVGAIDSIVDIVGVAAALAWIRPSRVTCRRVPLGGGTVKTAHGNLPVPAPATLELLRHAEVEAGGETELTTPTGAAVIAATATGFGAMPPLRVLAVGWGAGERQLADRPNLLRIVAGTPSTAEAQESSAGEVVIVEANIDDMNPEWVEPLVESLFAAGALDVWLTPIVMKKGRPALTVSAMGEPAAKEAMARALLVESSTIGVRHRAASRTVLPRRIVEVDTPFGAVPVKLAELDGKVVNAAPEYEACRRLARERGVAVKEVYQAAIAAYRR
jgi:uncharacterized protein (TIGR00299 family) protein